MSRSTFLLRVRILRGSIKRPIRSTEDHLILLPGACCLHISTGMRGTNRGNGKSVPTLPGHQKKPLNGHDPASLPILGGERETIDLASTPPSITNSKNI